MKKVKVVEDGDEELENGYIIYDLRVKRGFNKNQFISEVVKMENVKQVNEM